MMNGGMPSLADIAAVTRNNGDGFGGNDGWWILVLLFAIWGNNGAGFGNGGNGVDASLQRGFDTQTIISKLDGLNNGVCSLGYDQLAQMNGINTNVMQTGFTLQQAINMLSTQLSGCCCDQKTGQLQILNQMGTDTCSIINAIAQAVQTITQNCNANYQSLHDDNVKAILSSKDEKIAMLEQKLNNSDRDRSNAEQSAYLLSQLRPQQQFPQNIPWEVLFQLLGGQNGGCRGCNGFAN